MLTTAPRTTLSLILVVARLASASSTEKSLKTVFAGEVRGGNRKGAEALGQVIADRLKEKGITRVVFDRGGFLFHGRVKALADAAVSPADISCLIPCGTGHPIHDKAELAGLLDAVDRVAARVGEADDFRLGRLGLQQER